MSELGRGGRERTPSDKGQALLESKRAKAAAREASPSVRGPGRPVGSDSGSSHQRSNQHRKQVQKRLRAFAASQASADAHLLRKWQQNPEARAQMLAMARAAEQQDPDLALEALVRSADAGGLPVGDILRTLEQHFGIVLLEEGAEDSDSEQSSGDEGEEAVTSGRAAAEDGGEPLRGPGDASAAKASGSNRVWFL